MAKNSPKKNQQDYHREYNEFFATLSHERQEVHLALLLRWLLNHTAIEGVASNSPVVVTHPQRLLGGE